VSCCTAAGLEDAARTAAVLVVCSPNNPDGTRISPARLTALAEKLAARDGLLVLDEAFIDATPAQSLTAIAGSAAAPNLIVLRSLGKFFGLAGARVGVVAAAATWRAALREALGPWPLSGPARWAAARAWADADWQGRTRTALAASSIRLDQILRPLGECVATPLFCWLPRQQPRALFDALARRGILTRCFDAGDTAGIRIGLPGKSADWMRLAGNIDTLKDFHR
jgi:cobalamin biosynthetic protein CobC